jgi:hypothetical protein
VHAASEVKYDQAVSKRGSKIKARMLERKRGPGGWLQSTTSHTSGNRVPDPDDPAEREALRLRLFVEVYMDVYMDRGVQGVVDQVVYAKEHPRRSGAARGVRFILMGKLRAYLVKQHPLASGDEQVVIGTILSQFGVKGPWAGGAGVGGMGGVGGVDGVGGVGGVGTPSNEVQQEPAEAPARVQGSSERSPPPARNLSSAGAFGTPGSRDPSCTCGDDLFQCPVQHEVRSLYLLLFVVVCPPPSPHASTHPLLTPLPSCATGG